MSATELQTTPKAGDWSVNEILAHLRSCADVWGDCIAVMLAEDYSAIRPTIRAVNPRTWIERTDYRKQKFSASFEVFRKQRAELLARLKKLPNKSWTRKALVTGAGKPLERTVQFYAQWLAKHERTHVKQVARIAGRTGKK